MAPRFALFFCSSWQRAGQKVGLLWMISSIRRQGNVTVDDDTDANSGPNREGWLDAETSSCKRLSALVNGVLKTPAH